MKLLLFELWSTMAKMVSWHRSTKNKVYPGLLFANSFEWMLSISTFTLLNFSKTFGSFNAIVPRSLGPLVPWFLGPLVPRSLGPLVPRSLGSSVPRSLGPLVPWSFGSSVPRSLGPLVLWFLGSLVLWSHDPLVPWSPHKERNIKSRLDLADVNTVVCEQTNAWLKQYLNILCNLSGQRSKFYYLFLFHLMNCKRSSLKSECKH